MKYDFLQNGVNFDNMEPSFFLIGLINRFNNCFQAVADPFFEEISWKQVFFLNCITLFSEEPTIKDMAGLLGCSHQNAKQILSKLERAGFVTVKQDDSDKRKQRIMLTKQAEKFQKKYSKPSEEMMGEIFQDIDEDKLKIVIQVLGELVNRLKSFQEE